MVVRQWVWGLVMDGTNELDGAGTADPSQSNVNHAIMLFGGAHPNTGESPRG